MIDLTRMTDRGLRRWITGTTDWTDPAQQTDRILALPDEAYSEAERRHEPLALLRDAMNDTAENTPERSAAVRVYTETFVDWVTA